MVNKKNVLCMLLFLSFILLCGCNEKSSNKNNISKIEIYSAGDSILLGTYKNQDEISFLNEQLEIEPLNLSDEEIRSINNSQHPELNIKVYKKGVTAYDTGDKYIFMLTTYKGTDIVKMEVQPESIPSIKIPKNELVFYYRATQETIDNIYSILNNNKDSVSATPGKQVEISEEVTDSYHVGNPRISKIEIYSLSELIKTIKEHSICDEFQDKSAGSEEDYSGEEKKEILADKREKYRFVVYEKSFGKNKVMFELTLYDNSSVMKMYTPQSAVPFGIKLAEDDRTFIYKGRSDVIDYLTTLAQTN